MMEEAAIKRERDKLMKALSNAKDPREREKLMEEDRVLREQLTSLYTRSSPQAANARAQAQQKLAELQQMQAMGKDAFNAMRAQQQRGRR